MECLINDTALLASIIGGSFAILGTILGVLLSNWLRKGKIKVDIIRSDSPYPLPSLQMMRSNGYTKQSKLATECTLSLKVRMYNSSLDQNTIKSINVLFINNKTTLGTAELYEKAAIDFIPIAGKTMLTKIFTANIKDKAIFECSTQINLEVEYVKGRKSSIIIDKYRIIDEASILVYKNKRIESSESIDNKMEALISNILDKLMGWDVDANVAEDIKNSLESLTHKIEYKSSDVLEINRIEQSIMILSEKFGSNKSLSQIRQMLNEVKNLYHDKFA